MEIKSVMCTEAMREIQIDTRIADFGAELMGADRRVLARAPALLTIRPTSTDLGASSVYRAIPALRHDVIALAETPPPLARPFIEIPIKCLDTDAAQVRESMSGGYKDAGALANQPRGPSVKL
jgi:hypothetical protein